MDTSCVTYKSVDLAYSDLELSKIAILPVLEGEGFEGFRRNTGDEITQQVRSKFSGAEVLSPQQTLNLINDARLTDGYADLIEDYNRSAIINKQTLTQLGEALKARYLIYSKVGHSEDYIGSMSYYSFASYKILEGNIYCQVWDTQNGDIVWEGVGGAAALEGSPSSDLNSLIGMAAEGLSERIGKSNAETEQCKTTKDLRNQISKEYATPIYVTSGITILISLIVLATL